MPPLAGGTIDENPVSCLFRHDTSCTTKSNVAQDYHVVPVKKFARPAMNLNFQHFFKELKLMANST